VALEIQDEIEDLLATSSAKLKIEQPAPGAVLLCGEDGEIIALQQFLQDKLAVTLIHCDTQAQTIFRVKSAAESSIAGYEVAIGLALRQLEHDHQPQLRLIPDTIRQRAYFWSQRVFRFYALGIFLLSSLGLYWVGNYYDSVYQHNAETIEQKLRQAEQERKELLATKEGLQTVEKELVELKEQLFRPDPTLAIVKELKNLLADEMIILGIKTDRQGQEFVPRRNLSVQVKGAMRSNPHTPEVTYTRTMEELEDKIRRSPFFQQRGVEFAVRDQWIRTAQQSVTRGADFWPFELRFTFKAGTF
jgi:hypothetical protein